MKRTILTIFVALGLFITTSFQIESTQSPKNIIISLMDEPIDGNH